MTTGESGRRRVGRSVRALDAAADAKVCDRITLGLPAWFANEQGLAEQARLVRTSAGLVCDEEGGLAGFLTYAFLTPRTVEVTWMAVRADRRRSGIGKMLLDELLPILSHEGVRMLVVKTLSDREDPGPEYAATRRFYLACGFTPAAELDIWGPENPCQLLTMPIRGEADSLGVEAG